MLCCFHRHKTWLQVLARKKSALLTAKQGRFPGTPSIALSKGKGVLALSDVLVTWVVTDVEGSTQLWEWEPAVMDEAIELHNQVRVSAATLVTLQTLLHWFQLRLADSDLPTYIHDTCKCCKSVASHSSIDGVLEYSMYGG